MNDLEWKRMRKEEGVFNNTDQRLKLRYVTVHSNYFQKC